MKPEYSLVHKEIENLTMPAELAIEIAATPGYNANTNNAVDQSLIQVISR